MMKVGGMMVFFFATDRFSFYYVRSFLWHTSH